MLTPKIPVSTDLPGFVEIGPNTYARQIDPRLRPVIVHRGVDLERALANLSKNGWYLATDREQPTFSRERHFHTIYETQLVFDGVMRGRLGGAEGPVVTFRKGDVVFQPAGMRHEGLPQGSNARFGLAYVRGVRPSQFGLVPWDWKTSDDVERYLPTIAGRPAPRDPVTGRIVPPKIEDLL